jgi:hypothetical protein
MFAIQTRLPQKLGCPLRLGSLCCGDGDQNQIIEKIIRQANDHFAQRG